MDWKAKPGVRTVDEYRVKAFVEVEGGVMIPVSDEQWSTWPINCAGPRARFRSTSPRRSATESAAILDACRALSLTTPTSSEAGRVVLLRIVAMLTAMVKKSGSGSGSGSTHHADPLD